MEGSHSLHITISVGQKSSWGDFLEKVSVRIQSSCVMTCLLFVFFTILSCCLHVLQFLCVLCVHYENIVITNL